MHLLCSSWIARSTSLYTTARARRWQGLPGAALLTATLGLAGCGSVGGGVGIGIPLGPLSVGVGLGTGGLSAGVGTGWGPLGVGVGVNQRGQVTGNAGVGVSTGVGGARVGAGVGTSAVLHDPATATSGAPVPPPAAAAEATAPGDGPVQWRDASGQLVPACRVEGRC